MPSLWKNLRSLPASQRLTLAAAWVFSVILAAAVPWGLSRFAEDEATVPPPDESRAPVAETQNAVESLVPEPAPPPKRPAPKKRAPEPIPTPARSAPQPEPVSAEEPVAPTLPPPGVLDRTLRIDRLLEEAETDLAREDAEALLADHDGSYESLTRSLAADGAEDPGAMLLGLRVLQAAGYDEISRDVARELRRSHAGTADVAETIRRWKVLRPHVTSLETSTGRGRFVTASGTVANPDVVSVRRVRVVVVALDAAGNRVGEVSTRARPKRLDPEGSGTFQATFKGIDPATVLRTRARVVDYEYEVLAAEQP